MSETLGNWLREHIPIHWGDRAGPRLHTFWNALDDAGLDTAHIIRSDSGDVSIVTTETLRAAKRWWEQWYDLVGTEGSIDHGLEKLLCILLGDVEVAKEIVTVVMRREDQETVYHDEWYEYLGLNSLGQKRIQRRLGGMLRDGDSVVILHRKDSA